VASSENNGVFLDVEAKFSIPITFIMGSSGSDTSSSMVSSARTCELLQASSLIGPVCAGTGMGALAAKLENCYKHHCY